MSGFPGIRRQLLRTPHRWLVTGAAGFIGSNLVEFLLRHGQRVVGLDNFSTGHEKNLDEVLASVPEAADRFHLIRGDIRDPLACAEACRGADYVLHQAALGSVPRSLEDPVRTHATNVDGFLNVLVAARDSGVRRLVYASSSSVYGDHPGLPKREDTLGRLLSPYAVTKRANELYAEVFQGAYGLRSVGLRYFNVFGPRQDPASAYAAVIPMWVGSLLAERPCRINGDGETSRDFCYVQNVVQANVLAAMVEGEAAGGAHEVYNVALGGRTTLNELFAMIRAGLSAYRPELAEAEPVHGAFRAGDIRHSQADIGKIRERLGYDPTHSTAEGLSEALGWYVERLAPSGVGAGTGETADGELTSRLRA